MDPLAGLRLGVTEVDPLGGGWPDVPAGGCVDGRKARTAIAITPTEATTAGNHRPNSEAERALSL